MIRARRPFTLSALIALTTTLAACAPPGPDPEIVAELRNYDEAYANLVRGMKARPGPLSAEQDFRGQRYEQEMTQRVMTPDMRARLDRLRALAAAAPDLHMANVHLGEARGLLAEEAKRAAGISAYWIDATPAPYWRRYWNALFIANQEPVASPDPLLLSIETRVREALDRGDFQSAAEEAQMLPPVLGEAMNRVAGDLNESRKDKVEFAARRTPCPPGAPPERTSARPQIVPGEEIESYYPPHLKGLGVQGTVVLRVKVDRAGCARQVATVVHSGVPEIDQAALNWFETARFAAAWKGGQTVESKLSFKVRFRMVDEPDSHGSRESP